MNSDQVKGNWKQIAGQIRAKWGQLTEDDLAVANGNLEMVAGKIQEHYGLAKEQAELQLKEMARAEEDADEVAVEGDPIDTETLKKNI